METRWSEPPEDSTAIMSGILRKTSLLRASAGYAPRYLVLVPEFLYSYPESYSSEDPMPPLSRICLRGLVVTNNTDSTCGFVLLPSSAPNQACTERIKFIAPDVDVKRHWVEALHGAIANTANLSMQSGNSATNRIRSASLVDRSTRPIREGTLLKRQGRFAGYQPRWTEIRRGVGLLYGKYRSCPDDSFKVIPLLDQMVAMNPDKFRFSLLNGEGVEVHFKCNSSVEFAEWAEAIECEVHPLRGKDGKRLPPEEEKRVRLEGWRGGDATTQQSSFASRRSADPLDNRSPSTHALSSFCAFEGGADDDDASHCQSGGAKSPCTLTPLFNIDEPLECYPGFSNPTVGNRSKDGGNDDDEIIGNALRDPECLMEFRDLLSDVPLEGGHELRLPSTTPSKRDGANLLLMDVSPSQSAASALRSRLFSAKRLQRGVAVYLESVCSTYQPSASVEQPAPASSEEAAACLAAVQASDGAPAKLERLRDRMYTPFVDETYTALNEHIVLLDLDVQQLRQCLMQLLAEFSHSEAIRHTVVAIDDVLREYTCVREHLVIRRNIAAFRAQKDNAGLKLGIDQTIEFVRKLVSKDRGAPTEANWKKIQQLHDQMLNCLDAFRQEFDVFEAALPTIEAMDNAMACAREWLAMHEPLMSWGKLHKVSFDVEDSAAS